MEVLRSILKEEGFMSLYKGLKMALLGIIASYGIYFWWYRFLKNKFTLFLKRDKFTSAEITIITALAGSISSIFANPIWMLNTRLINMRKEDANVTEIQLIRQIWKNEGVGAFFKGVIPNLVLVLNPIINFVVYEMLKKPVLKKYGKEKLIPFSAIFLISSIGKILATFATYPILTLRTRLQANEKKVEGSMTAQFQRICEQIHDLGLSGLYFGIEAKLLQTVLYNAFLMMTYERLRTIIKILLLKAFILSN